MKSGPNETYFATIDVPTADVQLPIKIELMCLLYHDKLDGIAHADTVIAFTHKGKLYGIAGKLVVPHLRDQLKAKRDELRKKCAEDGAQSAAEYDSVEDSLDTWRIGYELDEHGVVRKTYTLEGCEDVGFAVSMDADNNVQFPTLQPGQTFAAECFSDTEVDMRLLRRALMETALDIVAAAEPEAKT